MTKSCPKCGESMLPQLDPPCDECRFKAAQASEARAFRKRYALKQARTVRTSLAFLAHLDYPEDAARLAALLRSAENAVSEANALLQTAKNEIRSTLARFWTPGQIKRAIDAEVEIRVACAFQPIPGNKGSK